MVVPSSENSPSSENFKPFDILPLELQTKIIGFLELPHQNALSQTCKSNNLVVKSNFIAMQNLKYLENNMMSLGPKIDYQNGLKGFVQKQDDALQRLEKRITEINDDQISNPIQKDKYIREANDQYNDEINALNEEVKKAPLEFRVDITDGKPIAYKILKRKIMDVYRDVHNLSVRSNNDSIEMLKSVYSYENTIILRKEYLLQLYDDLCKFSSFKKFYQNYFKIRLLELSSFSDFNDPILIESLKTLLNRIKISVILKSVDQLFDRTNELGLLRSKSGLFNELNKMKLDEFDNQSCENFIKGFNSYIKDNFNRIVHARYNDQSLILLIKIITSLKMSLIANKFPENFLHIWKDEFFMPFFNCIPKDEIFNILTTHDRNTPPLLFIATASIAGYPSNVVELKNISPMLVKFLLEQLDEDKRLDALNVKVNNTEDTIFDKIIQNTSDVGLIKTILETVFKDPKDRLNYVKRIVNDFQLRLLEEKDLIDWIDTLFTHEIDNNFSEINDEDLLLYLRFYLNLRDEKRLMNMLQKEKNPKKQANLILTLFKDFLSQKSYHSQNLLIKKPDMLKILNLLSDNLDKALFLENTGYYLIENNRDRQNILINEIKAGSKHFFIGLVRYGSIDSIKDTIDSLSINEQKDIIQKFLDFDQSPDVFKYLLMKLNKDEQIKLITKFQWPISRVIKHDLYELLNEMGILYECLLATKVKRGTSHPYPYSLMHCLVNASRKELEKKGVNTKQALSYILKTFEGKDRSEIIELLKTQVNRSTEHPTIYEKLIEYYPESKIRLTEIFPGIEDMMVLKRKRSESDSFLEDQMNRSDEGSKVARIEDSDEE